MEPIKNERIQTIKKRGIKKKRILRREKSNGLELVSDFDKKGRTIIMI